MKQYNTLSNFIRMPSSIPERTAGECQVNDHIRSHFDNVFGARIAAIMSKPFEVHNADQTVKTLRSIGIPRFQSMVRYSKRRLDRNRNTDLLKGFSVEDLLQYVTRTMFNEIVHGTNLVLNLALFPFTNLNVHLLLAIWELYIVLSQHQSRARISIILARDLQKVRSKIN